MHLKKLFVVTLSLFATIVLMAGTADAQVERAVFRSQVATDLSGHVANDILIDFSGIYTGSQLIVSLTNGEVYQNTGEFGGTDTPPLGALLNLDPTLRWDTFMAQGGPTAGETVSTVSAGGAAINANRDNPGRGFAFGTDGIDRAWNPPGGADIVDREDFMVARVTLTNDAEGEAIFIASANQQLGVPMAVAEGLFEGTFNGEAVPGGGNELRVVLPIFNGVIGGIPEPSTFVLLGISLVGLIALKRRNG